jgi:hypothetical protein
MNFVKKSLVFLSVLGLVVGFPQQSSGRTSNQVYVMPSSGNIPNWGPVNLGSSSAVTSILTHTNGGTDVSSPGTTGNVLTSNGTNWVSSPPFGASFTAPTETILLTTGTTVGYLFNFPTSSTIATGDVYQDANTNNHTSLVTFTSSSGNILFMTGAGVPPVSGTLTRISGSGSATIGYTSRVAIAQYNRPTSPTPLYLKIRMVGGGGGGGGSSTIGSPSTASTAGSTTSFGASPILQTNGGGGVASTNGGVGAAGGLGGTATCGILSSCVALTGATGTGNGYQNVGGGNLQYGGTPGGSTPFGGAGGGGTNGTTPTAGYAAVPNTGSGGGGGASQSSTISSNNGSGGGAGGYLEAMISNPGPTYYYAIGTGGAAGVGGGSTPANGGPGASGILIIGEFYQ